ncbi:cysteine dioxygenase [Vibrio sp. EA2]|uniref:cysteine dioxygenase family protein n=1 Tax=Vibrio sp. EA2 TaxID=3079860 RepID=UPI002949B786|nr:cysteine dioxygenase [Vibrio sp. EA2]MDV6250372.1 cysteine dioxygenase [Vibrio sp. EA2]
MRNIARLGDFVRSFTQLIEQVGQDEEHIFADGKVLLTELISHDDWLPDEFAQPNPEYYQQYLLYCDPLERFSVVSFVWGPGQETPVHDHSVWGMVGVMRGAESCEEFYLDPESERFASKGTHYLPVGSIDLVSPRIGDIHKVSNAHSNHTSLSIHVYGANIGGVSRHGYEPGTGKKKVFISGYSNEVLPNIWDRTKE